jgi:two-component system cell cycle sensor histidine kinase/response regulator CckA
MIVDHYTDPVRPVVATRPSEIDDPAGLLAGLAPGLRLLLGPEIELRLVVPGRIGPAVADPGALERALAALVAGARDAMPYGGTLTIELLEVNLGADAVAGRPQLRPGPYVAVAVSDTGRGVDARTLAHIFEPLRATVASRSGLAAVSRFAGRSGGFIAAASDPGRGTDVTIYLPRARARKPLRRAL